MMQTSTVILSVILMSIGVQCIPITPELSIPTPIDVARDIKARVEDLKMQLDNQISMLGTEALCTFFTNRFDALSNQGKLIRRTGDTQVLSVGPSNVASLFDILQTNTNSNIDSILSNVPIEEVSFQCNPLRLTMISQTYDNNFALIPDVLSVRNLSVTVVFESSFNTFITFSGSLVIAGEEVRVQMRYNSSGLEIDADFNALSLSIADIVSELTSLSLPLPDGFSFINEHFNIKGELIDTDNGIIVIGASFNTNDKAFVILQREGGVSKAAVAVDVSGVRLSTLIENVADQDISSFPYFGSITLPELGLAVSSGPITSDLLSKCFQNTNLLNCYNDTIPSGFSAFLKYGFSSATFAVTYDNGTTTFRVVKGSLKVRDLLALIPGVNIGNIHFPFGFPDIFDISITDFGFDVIHGFYISANLGDVLSFFNGILPPIRAPSISLSINNFAGDITPNFKIFGDFSIGNIDIPIGIDYLPDLGQFDIDLDFEIPSLSILDIVRELTTLSLPLPDSFTFSNEHFKISGRLDTHVNGIIVIGATFNSRDQAFVILQKENGVSRAAVAADVSGIRLSTLIKNAVDQDISSIPYFGSIILPELGLAVSSGPITSDLLSECFKNINLLNCYNGTLPSGFSAFLKYSFSSVTFGVTYDNGTTTFRVVKGSLNVRDLLAVIPGLNIGNIRLPSGFPDILDISITDFGFNPIHGFYLWADLGNVLSFFDGILPPIRAPSISLSIDNFVGNIIPNFKIFGDFRIGNIDIPIGIDYLPDLGQFDIDLDFEIPSLSILDIVRELTTLSLPLPDSFTFIDESFKISGRLDTNVNGIIVISATFNSHDQAFVIVQRENGVSKTAVAADVSRIQFSDLIENVANRDISSLPYFGSLVLPELGLAASSGSITSDLLNECFKNTNLLNCYNDTIPSGFSLFLELPFSSVIFGVGYSNGTFSFSPKRGSLSVEQLLNQIPGVNTQGLPLPLGLGDILSVNIRDFGFNAVRGSIYVEIGLRRTLEYFDGVVRVINPTVYLEVRQPGSDVVIEVYGDIEIAGTTLSLLITEDNNDVYSLDVSTNEISLRPLLQSFSASIVPSQLQSIAGSLPFLNFGVRDFRMVIPLSSTPSQVFLSGTPVIAGYNVIDLSGTIYRDQARNVLTVLEIDLGRPNLVSVLSQIAPFASGALRLISFLDRAVPTSLVISPRALSNIRLTKDALQSISIGEGITLRADLSIPSSCNGDLFCDITKTLLPAGTVLHIDSSIASTTNFQLVAGLSGDISLSNTLSMTRAGVELRVGEETSIGIIGQIALSNPRLDFTARIFQSVSGIILEMTASGCWYDAFGLPVVDVCNIHGSIGFGATLITELSLGGEIRFGVSSCSQGSPLVAIGHIGINTIQPQQNYYYVNFPNGLTFGALLRSLCVDTSLVPAPIADTGFQPGFLSSFTASPTGKSIPEINLYIPPGLQFNGTVNILGVQASANVSASQSVGIYASIALPPLDAAGLVQMFASNSDRSRGPFLIVDMRPPTSAVAEACGFVQVLGLSVASCMRITPLFMSISIEGRILGAVEVSITLSTTNGPFGSREFNARGRIDASEFHTIEDPIKSAANGVANAASNAISAAQDVVDNYRDDLSQASAVLNAAQGELQRVQGEFGNAENEVNRLSNEVNNICRTRNCGHVCVPGCGGCRCSWRGCSCDCSSCRHRIPDASCEAANRGCDALRAPIRALLNTARDTFNHLSGALNNARNAFNDATNRVNDISRQVSDAVSALDTVRNNYQVGEQILDQINVLGGLENILIIKEIVIESPLGVATQGRFQAMVRVRIYGESLNLNLEINITDLRNTLIRPLAERLGIGNLI